MAEWLRRWTANPLGSARVGSNPIFVAPPHWFYGVMVSTLDFESSDPSSNLGRTFVAVSRNDVVAAACMYQYERPLDWTSLSERKVSAE